MSNRVRTNVIRSVLVWGSLAVLLGMGVGCGASSPAGPTPTPATPAPAAPAPVGPQAVYTVTTGTNTVAPGGPLSVSWSASTKGGNDWIGLFKKGDPNTAHDWWSRWTEGATSGTFTLTAPTQAGQYEFRYLLDDGYGDAARSSVVTVAGS